MRRACALIAGCLAAFSPIAAYAQIAQTARSIAKPDNGNWEMPSKNYAATRFSAMREITPANVGKLKVAFTYPTKINKGHEAPPLVVGSMMYLITPYPNDLYAIDLTKKPKPDVKWIFHPRPVPQSQGVACCDVVNRGAVYSDDLGNSFLKGKKLLLDTCGKLTVS